LHFVLFFFRSIRAKEAARDDAMDDFGNDAVMKETVRLWRAWRTVHEMVADRVRLP
jgi:DNA-directed RNA polymerase I, II, and III subunit RPABC1